MPTFGEVLKAAREAAKLTQQQVAAKAGLSQAAVSKAELSATVDEAGRKETLEKIAAATGMTLETVVREASSVGSPQDEAAASSEQASPAEAWESPLNLKERAAQRRLENMSRGWWYTREFPNSQVISYLGDVIGRNFNHKSHKIVDSHAVISMLEEVDANTPILFSIPNHFSNEADLGVRALLSAMALLRKNGAERTFPNLLLAMIVSAGRLTIESVEHPEMFPIPPVIRQDGDDSDIPF